MMIERDILRAIVARWVATATPSDPGDVSSDLDYDFHYVMDTHADLVASGHVTYVGPPNTGDDHYDSRPVVPTIIGVREAIW